MTKNLPKNIIELSQDEVLMSPHIAIQRLQSVFIKHGKNTALKSNKFQKERELWIAAVFALTIREMTNKIYWLKANPIPQDTPDIFMTSHRNPTNKGLGVVREIVSIEIMEYESHAKTTIAKHIISKKLNKNYPKEFALICYIHSRTGEPFRLIDVIEPLRKEKIGIGEIWLLFNTLGQNTTEYTAARVYPEPAISSSVNYSKDLENPRQQDFLKETRGVDKELNYTKLGIAYVPLPKYEN